MPEAYLPLREGDEVQYRGVTAVVIDPAALPDGSVIIQVMVPAADLTWVARYRSFRRRRLP